jgi:hypothetical protein
MYIPKTSYYFGFLFLRNYHSGNIVGQDQEFWMTDQENTLKVWYIWPRWVIFWDQMILTIFAGNNLILFSIPLCYKNMNIYGRQPNTALKDVNIQNTTCFTKKTSHPQALQRTFQAEHKWCMFVYCNTYTYIIYVLPEMFFVRSEDG